MTKRIFALILLFLFFSPELFGAKKQNQEQEEEVDRYTNLLAHRKLIEAPTANVLPRGSFDFDVRIFPSGGVATTIDIGLLHRMMLSVSYGAANLIGEGGVDWNKRMEFAVKYRFFTESWDFPSIAFGYDSQGYGAYNDSLDRYTVKSKGLYAAVSKSYLVAEFPVGLHGGINYSLETDDKDKTPSVFFGMDARILKRDLGFAMEYDLALNDDNKQSQYGRGRGYLNFGIRWVVSEIFQVEFDMKNIFKNRKNVNTPSRELRLIYVEFF